MTAFASALAEGAAMLQQDVHDVVCSSSKDTFKEHELHYKTKGYFFHGHRTSLYAFSIPVVFNFCSITSLVVGRHL